jgi:hypothetical protein
MIALFRKVVLWYQRAGIVANIKWVNGDIDELTSQAVWHDSYDRDLKVLQSIRADLMRALNEVNRELCK